MSLCAIWPKSSVNTKESRVPFCGFSCLSFVQMSPERPSDLFFRLVSTNVETKKCRIKTTRSPKRPRMLVTTIY